MKRYVALKGFRPNGGVIYVETVGGAEDGRRTRLRHRERHSPDGFAWGYGGSAPSDTALSILWDLLDVEPSPQLYHDFKTAFVMAWPQDEGFSVSEAEIQAWLATRVNT